VARFRGTDAWGDGADDGSRTAIVWGAKHNMTIRQDQLERAVVLAKSYGATRLILFGSALTKPEQARDLDLACDGVMGWKLYELGAQLEEELRIPLDLIPLTPSTRLTRLIERRGKVLL
jgi:predicted nucleotidyltransferase